MAMQAGMQLDAVSAEGLLDAARRTPARHRRPGTWLHMALAGLHADVGWHTAANASTALCRHACSRQEAP